LKQKSLIYSSGFVDVIEYPAVIVSSEILAKTLYVYIGDLERSVLMGITPLIKPITLGSTGVVRVIEVLSGKTEYTGKYYTITPLGNRGLLSISVNGLLSNYVSLDDSYLEEEVISPMPQDAVKPLLNHALLVASKCEEPVLVEGCGFIGIALGLLLREMGVETQLYCESGKRNALIFDLNVASYISNLNKKWRTIVITSLDVASKYKVMRELEYSNLVISALSLTDWMPIKDSFNVKVNVIGRGRISISELESVIMSKSKKVLQILQKALKTIKVSDLEAVKGLLPPRGLGTIIIFD
jgi:hypothetical protein